jgi:hypothetical protein
MKIKQIIQQEPFSNISPDQWSGEYVSDYIIQIGYALSEFLSSEECIKVLCEEPEKIDAMKKTMNHVFELISNLTSTATYSKLSELKLVNQERMDDLIRSVSEFKKISALQNETTCMLDQKIIEVENEIQRAYSRLQ